MLQDLANKGFWAEKLKSEVKTLFTRKRSEKCIPKLLKFYMWLQL